MLGAMKTLAACLVLAGSACAAPDLHWVRTNHTVTLRAGEAVRWSLHHDPAAGKPFFHPLTLPDGTVLTDLRPDDHPWHRGLWWSWKFINGVNYWEEDRKTGRSDGTTELLDAQVETQADGAARIRQTLQYRVGAAAPLLAESRTIAVSAPAADGSYHLDWTSTFTANADVKLDRTPLPGEPGGQSWGGYAGLGLRLSPALKSWVYALDGATEHGNALNGKAGRWVDFAGPTGGVTLFDHPANPRHPTPWKVIQNMPFFAPAPLFRSGLALAAGESLTFRYRIAIRAGPTTAEALLRMWQDFARAVD